MFQGWKVSPIRFFHNIRGGNTEIDDKLVLDMRGEMEQMVLGWQVGSFIGVIFDEKFRGWEAKISFGEGRVENTQEMWFEPKKSCKRFCLQYQKNLWHYTSNQRSFQRKGSWRDNFHGRSSSIYVLNPCNQLIVLSITVFEPPIMLTGWRVTPWDKNIIWRGFWD